MKGKLLLLFVVWMVVSCNKPDAPDCFQKAGPVGTETRTIAGHIARVVIYDDIDLVLTNTYGPDLTEQARLEGPENLLPEIATDYDYATQTLTLRNDNTCSFVRKQGLTFTVELLASITHVENRGTGNISCTAPLVVPQFTLENRDASGIVNLAFESAEQVSIQDHTGVAEVSVTGETQWVELFNQGWGVLDASALIAETALTNNNSINTLKVNCTGYVYAAINNTGNTEVFGEPTLIEVVDQGDGTVIPIN